MYIFIMPSSLRKMLFIIFYIIYSIYIHIYIIVGPLLTKPPNTDNAEKLELKKEINKILVLV